MDKRAAEKNIRFFADELNITSLDKPFWQYSTGLKHRLAILRLLVLDRELIVMDEPGKSLDPQALQEFNQYLFKLTADFKKTVLFTTHSLPQAQCADKVVFLKAGQIIAQNDPRKEPIENTYFERMNNA